MTAMQRWQQEVVPAPPSRQEHCPDAFLTAMESYEEPSQSSRRAWRVTGDPTEYELKMRTVDMMRHHVYATQYRFRDLQAITEKYSNDVNFRVGYIYSRLDTLIKDMTIMLTRSHRTITDWLGRHMLKQAFDHLIYYTYFVKKNTDVTYIVEHMIKLHALNRRGRMPRVITAAPGNGSTSEPTAGSGAEGDDTGSGPTTPPVPPT